MVLPQDNSDGSIECMNEKRLPKKVCNVSYPFFRAKSKVKLGLGMGEGEGTGRVQEKQNILRDGKNMELKKGFYSENNIQNEHLKQHPN